MAKTGWPSEMNVNSVVKLQYPVGGTYFKHGSYKQNEVCVPEDRYVVLKKSADKVRLAVQLGESCTPHPSSKHIYEVSKRNFDALLDVCKVKR